MLSPRQFSSKSKRLSTNDYPCFDVTWDFPVSKNVEPEPDMTLILDEIIKLYKTETSLLQECVNGSVDRAVRGTMRHMAVQIFKTHDLNDIRNIAIPLLEEVCNRMSEINNKHIDLSIDMLLLELFWKKVNSM